MDLEQKQLAAISPVLISSRRCVSIDSIIRTAGVMGNAPFAMSVICFQVFIDF